MNKPIVLIDVDGVMTNHDVQFLEEVNELFGKSYVYEEHIDFEYSFLEPEEREYLYRGWETANYDGCSLSLNDEDVLKSLRTFCRPVACSTPFLGHIESKFRFLLRYFDRNDIILLGDKNLAGGDILVDDNERNIRRFREAGGFGVIFDQPWNQKIDGERAMTFDDIGAHVVDYMLERGIHDFGL